MQVKTIHLLLLSVVVFFVACNKKYIKEETPDTFAPVIKITTPTSGSAENSLFPINIVGTVTDLNLDSLEIIVTMPDSNDRVLIHKFPEVKGLNGFTFNESFTYSKIGAPVNCTALIQAKDKSGNWGSQSVNFIIFKI
jgi:hypothetical protein